MLAGNGGGACLRHSTLIRLNSAPYCRSGETPASALCPKWHSSVRPGTIPPPRPCECHKPPRASSCQGRAAPRRGLALIASEHGGRLEYGGASPCLCHPPSFSHQKDRRQSLVMHRPPPNRAARNAEYRRCGNRRSRPPYRCGREAARRARSRPPRLSAQ